MQSAERGHVVTSDRDMLLFWGSVVALIATAFGFVIRGMIMDDLGVEFGLTETQKGEIFGVGLWPFALSIVLFSLIIDKVGYGRAMVFAFCCHVASAIITIFATGYWMLYFGTFILALGNGTVEAVVNPVVATMFPREKTKWLNILHAGWPGGLVLGGLIIITLGDIDWQWKVGLVLLPTAAYGLMMLGRHFPVHERVKAGVSYRDMLREAGFLGALIVVTIMTFELQRVFGWGTVVSIAIIVVVAGGFGLYVRSLGRPMFIFLLLIMIPLATTELGTDSWITSLMEPEMRQLNLHPGWVLVYTSLIMAILRSFFAGPLVRKLTPLGLLAVSSILAIAGLLYLSEALGMSILLAATVYGLGKSFFWPTMLGVVAEQFPKGGALTINTIAGVGMLSVGILGAQFLGYVQDETATSNIAAYDVEMETDYGERYVEMDKGLFGQYMAVDIEAMEAAPEEDRAFLAGMRETAKKEALKVVAICPLIMLIGYIILLLYFRSKGGYNVAHLKEGGEEVHGH